MLASFLNGASCGCTRANVGATVKTRPIWRNILNQKKKAALHMYEMQTCPDQHHTHHANHPVLPLSSSPSTPHAPCAPAHAILLKHHSHPH